MNETHYSDLADLNQKPDRLLMRAILGHAHARENLEAEVVRLRSMQSTAHTKRADMLSVRAKIFRDVQNVFKDDTKETLHERIKEVERRLYIETLQNIIRTEGHKKRDP